MTVDADGKLWVAVYGGGAILQIDPETQTELMKIEMPVLCPTSMAFGGIFAPTFHLALRSFLVRDDNHACDVVVS